MLVYVCPDSLSACLLMLYDLCPHDVMILSSWFVNVCPHAL